MIVGFLEWGRVWRERNVELPPEQPCPMFTSPDCYLARKGSWHPFYSSFIHRKLGSGQLQVQISSSMFFLGLFGNTCSVLRVGTKHRTSSLLGLPCTPKQDLTEPTLRIWQTSQLEGSSIIQNATHPYSTVCASHRRGWAGFQVGPCSHRKSQVPILAQPWCAICPCHCSSGLIPTGPWCR